MLINQRQGGSPNRRLLKKQRYAPMAPPKRPGPAAIRPLAAAKPPAGAAPVPNPPAPPALPAAVTQHSGTMRANADQALQLAKTGYLDSAYRAAMNLGDPSVLAGLKADPAYAGYQFDQDPNSAFASIGRQETQGLLDADSASNANNAFFSGYRLQDRGKLSDEASRQRLGAGTTYLDALKQYASALGVAQGDWRGAYGEADQYDIDAALALDPVDLSGGTTAKPATGTLGPEVTTSSSTTGKKRPRKKTQTYTPQPAKKVPKKAGIK